MKTSTTKAKELHCSQWLNDACFFQRTAGLCFVVPEGNCFVQCIIIQLGKQISRIIQSQQRLEAL